MCSGGTFDYDGKKEQLTEVELELAEPDVWNDQKRAQDLGRERAALEQVVKTIEDLDQGVADTRELLEMIVEDGDASALEDVDDDINRLNSHLSTLEFRRMFGGATDANNAYLDIQSGSGGTEAQD